MKKINNTKKTNFFKKIFIKLCRLIGFEIIDQAKLTSPTLDKNLDETLSIQGKKSITIPLGQIDIKKRLKISKNSFLKVLPKNYLTKDIWEIRYSCSLKVPKLDLDIAVLEI